MGSAGRAQLDTKCIHVASDGVSVFEQGSSGDWSQPGHWTGDCQATVKEIRWSSASCWYVQNHTKTIATNYLKCFDSSQYKSAPTLNN